MAVLYEWSHHLTFCLCHCIIIVCIYFSTILYVHVGYLVLMHLQIFNTILQTYSFVDLADLSNSPLSLKFFILSLDTQFLP